MSNYLFAVINPDNACQSILSYYEPLTSPPDTYIPIESMDAIVLGSTWDGSSWTAPVASAGRSWRDQELSGSDWIVPLTDHPQRAAYITYRAALRAWPSTSDFPDTKPTLG